MPSLHTLFYIYISVALVGLSLSILSFMFGGGAEDADFHLDADHIDASHIDGGNGVTLSTLFSLRNFLLFLVGFGAAGAEAVNAGYNAWQASGFGLVGGVVLAILGLFFYRAIGKQQGNSAPRLAALVGKNASVITGIPLNGYGEIRMNNEFGTAVTLPAQSKDGAISSGSTVEVTDIVANVAMVKAVA